MSSWRPSRTGRHRSVPSRLPRVLDHRLVGLSGRHLMEAGNLSCRLVPARTTQLAGAPRAHATSRSASLPVIALLVLALTQGLMWSTFTAPLNGPDEPAHVAYVQYLAETGHGPHNGPGSGSVSTEIA